MVLRTVRRVVNFGYGGRQPADDVIHKPNSRLPLLSVGPTVTFPASECHRPGRYQFMLLNEQRHMCVSDFLGSLCDSGAAGY